MGRGHPQRSAAPITPLSNETSAGSQGLSPPRTEPAGAGAACSRVRTPAPPPALARAWGTSSCQAVPEVPWLGSPSSILTPGEARSTSDQAHSVSPAQPSPEVSRLPRLGQGLPACPDSPRIAPCWRLGLLFPHFTNPSRSSSANRSPGVSLPKLVPPSEPQFPRLPQDCPCPGWPGSLPFQD